MSLKTPSLCYADILTTPDHQGTVFINHVTSGETLQGGERNLIGCSRNKSATCRNCTSARVQPTTSLARDPGSWAGTLLVRPRT